MGAGASNHATTATPVHRPRIREAIGVSFALASAAAGAVAKSAVENASHSQIEQTPLQVKTAEALTSGPLRRQDRAFAVMATLVSTVTIGHELRRTAETSHPAQAPSGIR